MITDALFAIALKFGHALLAFATVHTLVQAWGLEQYGLWVAFTSIAVYVTMFDLGIGYGMRNKVAEAAGRRRLEDAESTVRIATLLYAIASGVALCAAVGVSLTTRPFSEHRIASAILWITSVVSFFLSIHANILQAMGRFRAFSALSLLAPLLWFCTVRVGGTGLATLEAAVLLYAATVLVQAITIATVSRHSHHFPVLRGPGIDWTEAKRLVKTGLQFFLLQVSALVLMNSGNFIIYNSLGPRDTTHYDVLNKIYSMFTLGFSVLVGIAWTEISKAKIIQDQARLQRIFWGLQLSSLLLMGIAIICALNVTSLARMLTGVEVSTDQALPFVLMTGTQALAFASAVFLNAFEQLRPQLVGILVGFPIFFLVIHVALKAKLGIAAVPLATAAAMLPSMMLCFVVARRLIATASAPKALQAGGA